MRDKPLDLDWIHRQVQEYPVPAGERTLEVVRLDDAPMDTTSQLRSLSTLTTIALKDPLQKAREFLRQRFGDRVELLRAKAF